MCIRDRLFSLYFLYFLSGRTTKKWYLGPRPIGFGRFPKIQKENMYARNYSRVGALFLRRVLGEHKPQSFADYAMNFTSIKPRTAFLAKYTPPRPCDEFYLRVLSFKKKEGREKRGKREERREKREESREAPFTCNGMVVKAPHSGIRLPSLIILHLHCLTVIFTLLCWFRLVSRRFAGLVCMFCGGWTGPPLQQFTGVFHSIFNIFFQTLWRRFF